MNTRLGYNADGRLACETPTNATGGCDQTIATTLNYSYDDAGQLTASTPVSSGDTHAWTYSPRGHRLSQTKNSTTSYSTYNANGELLCTTDTQTATDCDAITTGDITYTNDTDGRQTEKRTEAGTTDTVVATAYDPRGKPVQAVTTSTNPTITELRWYNANDNLVRVTANGVGYDTIWDQNPAAGGVPQILEAKSSSTTRTRFNYGSDRVSINDGTTVKYYAYDAHGSVIGTSDIAAPDRYNPYGEPDNNDGGYLYFGYRGELTINGSVHLRARDYSPSTGMFTTRDPMGGVDGTAVVANSYHYADNDPMNKEDPSGLSPTIDGTFTGSVLPSNEGGSCPVTGYNNNWWITSLAIYGHCTAPTSMPTAPTTTTTTTTTAQNYQQMIDSIGAAASSRRNVGALHVGCNPGIGCVSQGIYGPPSTQWSGAGMDVWVDVQRILGCTKDGGKYCGSDRLKVVVLHEMAHGASLHVVGNLVYPGTLVAGIQDLMSREDALALLAPAGVPANWSGEQYRVNVWEPLSDCIAVRWGAPPGNLEHGCPPELGSLVDGVLA